MKIREIWCPYDSFQLEYVGTKRLLFLFAAPVPVSIYKCPRCGKLELFRFRKPKKKKRRI